MLSSDLNSKQRLYLVNKQTNTQNKKTTQQNPKQKKTKKTLQYPDRNEQRNSTD